MNSNVESSTADRKELFGHPVGLYILFFTEMWERFSYYGMRAILTYYMISSATGDNPGLGWDNSHALSIYGWYTMLVYVMSIPGGIVADKLFGQKRTVLYGGMILVAGHLVLAIDTVWAFYSGLILVILGVGGLKPNISTMVGGLYPGKDDRRDQGFTIFYIGINVGALLAGLIVGTIGEVYGWHYGFGLAGIGMGIAQVIYWWGQKFLSGVGEKPIRKKTKSKADTKQVEGKTDEEETSSFGALLAELFRSPMQLIFTFLIAIIGSFLSFYFSSGGNVYGYTLLSIFLALTSGVLMMIYKEITQVEKDRFMVLIISFLIVIVFWGAFEQAGGLLSIYTREKIDREVMIYVLDAIFIIAGLVLLLIAIVNTVKKKMDMAKLFYALSIVIFGVYAYLRIDVFTNPYEIPAAVFQSVNPLFIIVFGTPVAAFWILWKKKGLEHSSLFKMAIGTIIMGIGFLFMAQASNDITEHGDKAALVMLILAYLFHTLGELSASPVALSFITKIAPLKYVSIMMGVYFAATGLGNKLAGTIGESAKPEPIKIELAQNPTNYIADSTYNNAENFKIVGKIQVEAAEVLIRKDGSNLNELIKLDEEDTKRVKKSITDFKESADEPLTAVLRYEYDAKEKKLVEEGSKVQKKYYKGQLEVFEIQDKREFWTFISIFGFTAAFGLLLILFIKKLKKLTHRAEETIDPHEPYPDDEYSVDPDAQEKHE